MTNTAQQDITNLLAELFIAEAAHIEAVRLHNQTLDELRVSEAGDFNADAHKLAMALEGVRMSTEDDVACAKWWSLARVRPDTHKAAPQVVASIKAVSFTLEKDEPARLAEWLAEWSAARLAAWSERSPARLAAESAAASAKWSAAVLAARSARSATSSAEIQHQRDDLLLICRELVRMSNDNKH